METEPTFGEPPEREAFHQNGRASRSAGRRWWLDVLLFLVLTLAAFPSRWAETVGDLWYDEADYARAGAAGFEANRWDLPGPPEEPERLVRLRHYHPPLVAQVLTLAQQFGTDEQTLRAPFVVIGCLSVGLLYLCGLSLFPGRGSPRERQPLRVVAAAAAVILIFTPAHIRASSHAIPWAWITFWLLALLWCFLKYRETGRSGWLALSGGVLGALFVTSEYVFPTVLMAAFGIGLLLWSQRESLRNRGVQLLLDFLLGVALFALVVVAFWPVGPIGGALKMLQHYVEMADTTAFPVVIEGQQYTRAPRWAYLYWYWTEFRPFFFLYALGFLAVLWLLVRRCLDLGTGLVALLSLGILAVAHRAHIIGPEYLSHALPFLTLLGCVPLAALARAQPAHSLPVIGACCFVLATAPEVQPLNGMEPRSQVPRWPAASAFLAERWRPGDRMLASQFAVTARWYLLHYRGVQANIEDIQPLPPADASPELLQELLEGRYRWIAVGNTFSDWTEVDNRIRMLIQRWPVAFRSDEQELGLPRLQIVECPAGASPENPLPRPWIPEYPWEWPEYWWPY